MSLFEKFKFFSELTDELTKEKPTITITSNNALFCENYLSVKLFREDCIVIEFEDYDITISGNRLSIGYFTPASLSLSGNIKHMDYKFLKSEEVDEDYPEE